MHFFLILFPIFCIFIVGFIGQKTLRFDISALSKMALYVLSPFLSFKTFYSHELTISYLYYVFYVLLLCVILASIVTLWAYLMKYNLKERCALVLASCFMNNGNYGTPVILVFFGAIGFDVAVILMVLQQFIMSTIGVYFAAKGSEYSISQKEVFKRVFRMPIAYGALLGIMFQLLHIPLSDQIMLAVSMIGDSSIPVIMLILGMQLATLHIRQVEIAKVSFALLIRMVVSPLVALVLVYFMPIDYMSKQVLIVLAAMPSAANTTLLSVQFNTKPEMVSSATFLSTLISLITLPIVLWLVDPPIVF
ncbi:AEC family transporter [Zophobihabitans entericus]|uniref:AEC family transporter n=1 Tax=Zophobihabitans entericus TaxID=1635327 RepID=A0A6G9IDE2_9GAMM|nr:AEC family transporter [Zophobihabitans entericus]QIQ22243.1 AEC family transporter [Zophobihabitans entericus]